MTDIVTKKRLGQYFSGKKVANLLARLCLLTGEEYVIDPMAGIGDMLTAVIQLGIPEKQIAGIEIDPNIGIRCGTRVNPSNIYIGDAFSLKSYLTLGRKAWDLVITNPPYVRYQSMGRCANDEIRLKDAHETRRSLDKLVEMVDHLGDDEKACFRRIIRNYSGLSDLAVPAWILCAILTKTDGRIAMVVPESWISRDYALSIKYMLLKFFEIEYIVEDLDSVWFPDAQVKTNLFVAKRVAYRESLSEIFDWDSSYKHIRLGAELNDDHCLVGQLFFNDKEGIEALDGLLQSNWDVSGEGFEIRNVNLSSFLSEISTSQTYKKLLKRLEPNGDQMTEICIPKELQEVIGGDIISSRLVKLEDWGFRVGQGLRTGANKFFYTRLLKTEGVVDHLITDKIFENKIVPVMQKYSQPTLRYQRDIGDGLLVSKALLPHRLLYIQEDIYDMEGRVRDEADAMLAEHISIAGHIPIKSRGQRTIIPELSAVKSNIRNHKAGSEMMRRHWFMLPILTNRHIPELCIPRVNHGNTRCCLMADKGIVVDANFSTLWSVSVDKQKTYAMFALLNSTWTQSYLETIATVMGGGALKVEASHVRRLLLPFPTDELILSLSLLGKLLAEENPSKNKNILVEIDQVVLNSLVEGSSHSEKCASLRFYLQSKVSGRKR